MVTGCNVIFMCRVLLVQVDLDADVFRFWTVRVLYKGHNSIFQYMEEMGGAQSSRTWKIVTSSLSAPERGCGIIPALLIRPPHEQHFEETPAS